MSRIGSRTDPPARPGDTEANTSAVDMLIKLLERQQALAEQLDELTRRQAKLIEAGDSDGLLALLAQRQRIMDQFLGAQDSLGRLSEACKRDESATEGARRRIGVLIDDISNRLSEIMGRDEKDRDLLEKHREGVGETLSGLSHANQARQAYVKAQAVKNRFADRRG